MLSVLARLTHAFERYLHGLSPCFGNRRYEIGSRIGRQYVPVPNRRLISPIHTYRIIPRPVANFTRTMATQTTTNSVLDGTPAQRVEIALSSRMSTGRAMSLDVWSVFNAANLPSDCINLGQGYMNFGPPEWVLKAASEALATVPANHYSHPKGRIRLREAIRDFYSADFKRALNVDTEILVTSGANEGQYAVFVAYLEPGDEVIMFEPYFDQWLPSITFNHGVPVYVPLHPPPPGQAKSTSNDWTIDFDELRKAVTSKTKMIIVNTPHNPVGKVFTQQELEGIAAIAKEHNLLVMSDEVYDGLVFDNKPHVRICNLPGMWDRTITVLSAGKSFACTGWRIGYLIGPEALIGPTLAATTRIVFCSNSPLQEAAAAGLEQAKQRGFFQQQLKEYQERRDTLLRYFDEIGLRYSVPEGTYFVLVDVSDVEYPEDYPFPATIKGRGKDFHVAWFLAQKLGVSSIPVSEFYCDEHRHIGERFLRFAFCKDLDTLKEAGERLRGITKFLKKH